MELIDTHAHLQWPQYANELPALYERAQKAQVKKMIVVATEVSNLEKTVALSHSEDFLWAAVGVHPHDTKDIQKPADMQKIKKLGLDEKVVAIGEIGLDYYYENSPQKTQIEYFERQIDIAKELKKPIIIHSRSAPKETVHVLKKTQASLVGGVLHCFTESLEFAKSVLDLGFYISFTGIITFKKKVEALQEVVRFVPLESMLLETDCPFLAPEPYRGKTNEPSFLKHSALKVAELKNTTLEKVAEITTLNAKKLFKI
ncbi:MAG: TatD family hydrolase [Deltaproteobacteria bacterium]|nr:TatD family hydrolase [Deltaproteobacteria bacterium]